MNTPVKFFATSNTKLAATLRVFQINLPRTNPGLPVDVYKWSDLQRGFKDPQPPRRVFWNFDPDPNANLIWAAFESKTATSELDEFTETLELKPETRAQLKAFQSAAMAQVCREVMHMYEELVKETHRIPYVSLYEGAINDDGSLRWIFAKSASAETKAKYFTK